MRLQSQLVILCECGEAQGAQTPGLHGMCTNQLARAREQLEYCDSQPSTATLYMINLCVCIYTFILYMVKLLTMFLKMDVLRHQGAKLGPLS